MKRKDDKMKNWKVKLATIFVALSIGGCASTATTPIGAGLIRYEYVLLRNPQTNRTLYCRMRISNQTPRAAWPAVEATQKACIRNAQAVGYTNVFQQTRWP